MNDSLIKKLQSVAGKRFSVTYASDPEASFYVTDWISTGCLALDKIMGEGVPMGRIVEIFGGSSSGKSLIAEQIAAQAQSEGIIVLYIDTERAVSVDMLRAANVDIDTLIYAEPVTIQETFELMEAFVNGKGSKSKGLIVWDSIAATTEDSEEAAGYENQQMAVHARAISKGLRKFNSKIKRSNTAAVFVNQTRTKLGVMFGDNTATFGGSAVEFYSSVRIQLKQGPKIKDGKRVIGIINRAKCVKNKVSVPFMDAELPIYFGFGIDDAASSLPFMLEYYDDVVFQEKKKSAYYTFLTEDDDAIKFTKKTWADKVYEPYYDELEDLLFS